MESSTWCKVMAPWEWICAGTESLRYYFTGSFAVGESIRLHALTGQISLWKWEEIVLLSCGCFGFGCCRLWHSAVGLHYSRATVFRCEGSFCPTTNSEMHFCHDWWMCARI